jgi:hypothetical protein
VKYILPIFLCLYVLVMFIVSSVWQPIIMHPAVFLWAFMLFIAGPIMFLVSFVIVIRRTLKHTLSTVSLATALLCLVLIPTWTFGFWAIGRFCRPIMFSIVLSTNTQIAESAIRDHPQAERFMIQGFRYPLCRLCVAFAYHKDNVLFITVPSAPGPKDRILYDPEGKKDHARDQLLGGAFWFRKATIYGDS